MKTLLLCTVGGASEPIVKALQAVQPDRVCFICSGDDPATGSKGSYTQVVGKGLCIKQHPGEEQPSLPNIPTQAKLSADQFEVLRVGSDDLDHMVATLQAWLEEQDTDATRIVANYTGGTKTMSAGLVVFALENEGVQLDLITDKRTNLVKVAASGGRSVPVSVEQIRTRRQIREALSLWRHHAYSEAGALLRIPVPSDAGVRGELTQALDLSRGFAAWDRFDHAEASTILGDYRKRLAPAHADWFTGLDKLVSEGPSQEPARIFDLFRNAQRRAVAGRYDDAVARLYRLLEWSAQWLLRETAGLETSDLPEERLPQGMAIPPNREGRRQVGLFQAWELLAHQGHPAISGFWEQERDTVLDGLKTRNASILAHGFSPLSETQWTQLSEWTEARLLPLLLEITQQSKYRIRQLPEQLPTAFNPPLEADHDRLCS